MTTPPAEVKWTDFYKPGDEVLVKATVAKHALGPPGLWVQVGDNATRWVLVKADDIHPWPEGEA